MRNKLGRKSRFSKRGPSGVSSGPPTGRATGSNPGHENASWGRVVTAQLTFLSVRITPGSAPGCQWGRQKSGESVDRFSRKSHFCKKNHAARAHTCHTQMMRHCVRTAALSTPKPCTLYSPLVGILSSIPTSGLYNVQGCGPPGYRRPSTPRVCTTDAAHTGKLFFNEGT